MCGIVGLSSHSWSQDEFDELFASILHRGPNGSGSAAINGLRVGMHRLRLRGPDASLPITTEEFICSFNGQVYGLFGKDGGYDVIPSGLEHEVRSILSQPERVDGMYACAVVSPDGQTTRLTTDPFFIKPLFFRRFAQDVAFCSEFRPLVRLVSKNRINRNALADLFGYGWYLDSQSWIDDLHLVNRSDIVIDAGGFHQTPCPVFAPRNLPSTHAELRSIIRKSVERCVDGIGPFGLALSGGLDSTILASELNDIGVEDLVTISVLSGEDGDGIVSLDQLGLPSSGAWRTWRHRVVQIEDSEFVGIFEDSVRRFGHPTNMSSLPLYQSLADAAYENGVRVLLLGEGADELFGGYSSYRKVSGLPNILSYYTSPRRVSLLQILFSDAELSSSAMRFANLYGDRRDIRQIEIEMRLQRLLLRTDVCLMSRSIEGRLPFLHNGIPELAMGLDFNDVVAGAGKSPLRSAYSAVLGARASSAKTRFKCSDVSVRACMAQSSIQSRMVCALGKVFSKGAVQRALNALLTDDGFDADVCCLLLSLTFLIEEGCIIADAD